ncbi:reverse transcriptase [Gossypium australe]|uniref:Reverse transcriptase n=1 Tax=Gossypium australe TaxID=47621 RepID=A0A5B6WII0_9ROSI|nr:reverse transcriptase [Gossypium australe]
MNLGLTSDYTMEEVVFALKSMRLTKASGSDGFLTLFFKNFWHIVWHEVGGFCLDILNKGGSIYEVNLTNIVLIPKVAHPTNLKNFHPICLCTLRIGSKKFCTYVLMKQKVLLF